MPGLFGTGDINAVKNNNKKKNIASAQQPVTAQAIMLAIAVI